MWNWLKYVWPRLKPFSPNWPNCPIYFDLKAEKYKWSCYDLQSYFPQISLLDELVTRRSNFENYIFVSEILCGILKWFLPYLIISHFKYSIKSIVNKEMHLTKNTFGICLVSQICILCWHIERKNFLKKLISVFIKIFISHKFQEQHNIYLWQRYQVTSELHSQGRKRV